ITRMFGFCDISLTFSGIAVPCLQAVTMFKRKLLVLPALLAGLSPGRCFAWLRTWTLGAGERDCHCGSTFHRSRVFRLLESQTRSKVMHLSSRFTCYK